MPSATRHSKLAQWFLEVRKPLRRFIASRQNVVPADVDDVAQEVFLRLLRYEREELVIDARSYLFKIAANVASEWSMRAQRRWPHDSAWLDGLAYESGIVDELERSQRHEDIRDALATLPARAREILRLHFGENLTHEAIATQLGVSRRIVKRDIIAAYVSLRSALSVSHDSSLRLELIRGALEGAQ
jgi:RNA polymerase sigma factor (sigma-70 family)